MRPDVERHIRLVPAKLELCNDRRGKHIPIVHLLELANGARWGIPGKAIEDTVFLPIIFIRFMNKNKPRGMVGQPRRYNTREAQRQPASGRRRDCQRVGKVRQTYGRTGDGKAMTAGHGKAMTAGQKKAINPEPISAIKKPPLKACSPLKSRQVRRRRRRQRLRLGRIDKSG